MGLGASPLRGLSRWREGWDGMVKLPVGGLVLTDAHLS